MIATEIPAGQNRHPTGTRHGECHRAKLGKAFETETRDGNSEATSVRSNGLPQLSPIGSRQVPAGFNVWAHNSSPYRDRALDHQVEIVRDHDER